MNYILIVSDGWRADMGLSPALTPKLHRFWFDNGGWIFNNCYSTSTWTLPVQMSLYTGLLPSHHGVHDITFAHRRHLIAKDPKYFSSTCKPEELVMNRLKSQGYSTKYFTPDYHKDFLLETAHCYYDKIIPWDYFFMQLDKIFNEPVKKPFFWMLYDMDACHPPYGEIMRDRKEDLSGQKMVTDNLVRHLPQVYTPPKVRWMVQQQVTQYDRKLGHFLKWFKDTGLYKDTALFICGDHGEALWEHGWVGHVFNVYEEIIKVPLFVYFPTLLRNDTLKPIGQSVSIIDIVPTILSLETVGDARNLFVRKRHRPVFFEFTRLADPEPEDRVWKSLPSKVTCIRGARFGKYKFIYNRDMDNKITTELYDFKHIPSLAEEEEHRISSAEIEGYFMEQLKEQFTGIE